MDVRKSSWDQTSIQWRSDALASCVERSAVLREPVAGGPVFTGCRALAEAIGEAAVRGEVPVQSEA